MTNKSQIFITVLSFLALILSNALRTDAIQSRRVLNFNTKSPAVMHEIRESKIRNRYAIRTYVVQYTYLTKSYHYSFWLGIDQKTYKKGDTLNVFFDSVNPEDVEIYENIKKEHSYSTLVLATLASLIFLIILLYRITITVKLFLFL